MSQYPFFSILLPTKNRSHLVGHAIRSVLQQDFTDFELIVSDNDDDSLATRLVVQQFSGDRRVKYIRTGGLHMVSNWNVALGQSVGKNIIVLEDKHAIFNGALGKISKLISASRSGVVVWQSEYVNPDDMKISEFSNLTESSQEVQIEGHNILSSLTKDFYNSWCYLPRGICSSIPRVVMDRIQENSTRKWFEPIALDFNSALKTLSHINNYLFYPRSLVAILSAEESNGKKYVKRLVTDHSYYAGAGDYKLNLRYSPLESQFSVSNLLIDDFFKMRAEYGGSLLRHSISEQDQFKMLFVEFARCTLARKRIVWEREELIGMLFMGRGAIFNCYYASQYISTSLFKKLMALPKTLRRLSVS